MYKLNSTLHFALVLLLPIALLGCDSGGNGGNPLDGSLSYEVDGGDALVSVTESYFYSTSDGVCQTTRSDFTVEAPVEESLGPDETNCDGVSPGDFNGVRVNVSLQSGETDLTLRLLSDGDTVDEATEPSDFGGGRGSWRLARSPTCPSSSVGPVGYR
jgi:hypothetical protein